MSSPVCKTPSRSQNARSPSLSFFVADDQEKVQRAVLFPPLVEVILRNVSMLTFVRRRNGPLREEVPVIHPKAICVDVEHSNLQHAEDCACKTWRMRTEDPLTRAGRSCPNSRFRNVSRLTWLFDPRRPRVQPAEHFLRVEGASLGWKISSLEQRSFSSKPGSAMSGPDIFSRRNELVQDRDAGDMWYAFIPPRERPCQS